MEFKGVNLCDFCFEPLEEDNVCKHCGLTHETYNAEGGLLMPGTNIMGKYIIGRVIGRGGFGATYLAYSAEKDGVVAIKEYYPVGIATRGKGEEMISIVSESKKDIFERGAKRFYEETLTISKFNAHRNIVSVYEFFYANGTAYYAMEYLEGIDLKGYIDQKGGKISEGEAVAIMRAVCEALVIVHSTLTLHRDISPDNIFICTNGDVKLIDFGAAKQVISDAERSYSVVVKKGYAPLEQYKTDGNQGVWTDIYALGATMYSAVVGEAPPDAMLRTEEPEIVFDSSLNISDQFIQIIKKCMEVQIGNRYQSALELIGALNEFGMQSISVGGDAYVQQVYNGVTSGLQSGSEVFKYTYASHAGGNGQNMQMQQQNMHTPGFSKEDKIKLWIIGICAIISLALLVVLIVNAVSLAIGPGTPPGGMPMQPPAGMPMQPPAGMPMQPPAGMPMQPPAEIPIQQ